MKAVFYEKHGGLEDLQLGEFPDPSPGPADCLVRVRAVSLNGFEPMILFGKTGLRTPLPMIPGGDVAGEIAYSGELVRHLWPLGSRVVVNPNTDAGVVGETRLGGCADLLSVPAKNIHPIPNEVSFEAAATLPIAYGTARRMLMARGQIKAGETVLVHGATGGVGVACIQLLKSMDATVIATGSAAWKLDRLRLLGADHVIDNSRADFVREIHATWGKPSVRGGGGIDVVINYIGGETWANSLRVLKRHGRMLTCGATAGHSPMTDIRYLWSFELTVIGSDGWLDEDIVCLLDMVRAGTLKPVIHAVRPLSEAGRSIADLMERKILGKIVLQP